MIEEALDFFLSFNKINELMVVRVKLQCLLKISLLLNKNVIISYHMLIEKIFLVCKSLIGKK